MQVPTLGPDADSHPADRPDAPAAELEFAARALRAEAEAVLRVAAGLDASFARAVDLLTAAADRGGSVVVTGMGKSGLIGQKISATLASLGAPSHWLHPADAVHGDLGRLRAGDCLLALSYSGGTAEVVALASILRQDGVPIISITTGRGGSALERLSTVSLGIGVVEEACSLTLAPTSSTTAMLALGDALALAVSRRRAFSADDFLKRHPGGALGDQLRPVVEILRFVAGRNLPIVSESTLLRDALRSAEALGRRPGAIVVVNGAGALSGIFTDGDLRRLVARDPADVDSKRLGDVMTRSPRSLPHTAVVRDAVQMMREHRQDEIPVVDDMGRPVGVLDVQDLMAMKLIED